MVTQFGSLLTNRQDCFFNATQKKGILNKATFALRMTCFILFYVYVCAYVMLFCVYLQEIFILVVCLTYKLIA
jgi:hypothetical protein